MDSKYSGKDTLNSADSKYNKSSTVCTVVQLLWTVRSVSTSSTVSKEVPILLRVSTVSTLSTAV